MRRFTWFVEHHCFSSFLIGEDCGIMAKVGRYLDDI